MAERRNSINTTSPSFAFFNRSFTTVQSPKEKPPQQKSPQLERAGSLTKFVESARGSVVKRLCNFFEKPASPPELLLPKSKLSTKPTENSVSLGESFSSKQTQSKLIDNFSDSSGKLKPSKSIDNLSDSSAKFLDFSSGIRLPGTEDRIVLYFTSLRGIRRTYEDCYAVRMIFRGFRVWVDERDISMDSDYRKELMSLFSEKNKKNGHVVLPQVFIRGRHVGSADVIKQMYEVGELGKLLEGLPRTKPGFVCESCGDVRFVPCGNCSGSRKVFDENEGLLKRCLECNENGLIRCPNCCS